MLQGAVEDVREDFHIAVAVRAETAAGGDAVVVKDAQGAEAHVGRVEVVAEGERVGRVEPAQARPASVGGTSDVQHRKTPFTKRPLRHERRDERAKP